MIALKTVLVAFIVLMAAPCMKAAPEARETGKAAGTEIISPDKVDFNYPPPPKEGQKDFFTIAVDGKPRCVVVHPRRKNQDEMRGAFMLKTYLSLATSTDIPLLTEGDPLPPDTAVIHVGNTKVAQQAELNLPDLQYGQITLPNIEGYLIKTLDERTLIIRGAQPSATTLGVVGFLKRYVGVRRYWPGNPGGLGDVVPRNPTLRIPQVEWRDWPYFISCSMSLVDSMGPEIEEPYAPYFRNGFFTWLRLHYTIPSNESYYRLLPIKEYGKSHPEYFPLINGQRYIPTAPNAQGWQPCVSNPDVAKIMAEALKNHFRSNTNAIAKNLAVNDGLGDCTCDKCRAMDPPGADISTRKGLADRYIKFNNSVCKIVASEFPGKIIAFLSYGSLKHPPATVKLHSMLMPSITTAGNQNMFEVWDAWAETGAAHMGIYLYHNDMWFLLPKMDIHQAAKRIRYMVASNRGRSFYHEFVGLWPIDGMVGHVEAELLWDPRLNPDDILNEYYRSFYGPAAGPMKQFYEILEAGYERYLQNEGLPHPFGKDIESLSGARSIAQFKVLCPAEADRALAALKQARAAAKADSLVSKRIDIVGIIFTFADLGLRQYWLIQEMEKRTVGTQADALAAVTDGRRLLKLTQAFGDHKQDVMEQSPANLYSKHLRDEFYAVIPTNGILSECWIAVSAKFRQVSEYLRRDLGPERAGEWWVAQRTGEQDKWLLLAMRNAEVVARGIVLTNLVTDPGFETRGARATPGNISDSARKNGIHLFFTPGTGTHVELTKQEAHSGDYSVLLADCQRTSQNESADASAGECFRFSVWVKHNEVEGASYSVFFMTRNGADSVISRTPVPIPWKPGAWQEITMDVIAPENTAKVQLYVSVFGQPSGGKIWIDDFFIAKVPRTSLDRP